MEKVQLNTSVEKKTKKKLKEISLETEKTMGEILDRIIDEEYVKTKKED